jgi:hypothetical protein
MPQRDQRIAESLHARGLITMAPAAITDPKGLPVFTLEAVEALQP